MKVTVLLWLLLITGCASPNPNYNPALPTGTNNLPNVPNQTLAGLNQAAKPILPLIPAPYGDLAGGVLALATGISLVLAKNKNAVAVANKATADQLAASVVAQGPAVAQAVLDHASNNEVVFPAVANVINQKTV